VSSFKFRWIIFVTLFATVSCGPLPRPFETSSQKLVNPLLQIKDSYGVVIVPIYEAPPEVAAPLANLLARRLVKHEIPATSNDVLTLGNLLEGWYRLENSIAGSVEVIVDWQLSDRYGKNILVKTSRIKAPAVSLAAPDARPIVYGLANDMLPHVVEHFVTNTHSATVERRSKTLAVGTVIGTRGDGAIALRQAFKTVLQRGDIGYTETTRGATAIIDGEIKVSPISENTEKIRIVWTIRNSAQKEIAVFKQQNKIPKGRLSRPWGSLAFDIVLAMQGQILEAMRRLETSGDKTLRIPPNLKKASNRQF
jgi:hypothetical protein